MTATDAPPRRGRARYWRAYYEAHREAILAKNRRWAAENRERVRELTRRRREAVAPAPRACPDCGAPVARAVRCLRCHRRRRWATDPEYRARRKDALRRWRERRRADESESALGSPPSGARF